MPFSPPSGRPREVVLREAKEELASLVGMNEFKAQMKEFEAYALSQVERRRRGLPTTQVTLHMVLTGPPGTGKTTVARIMGKFLYGLGLLPTDAFFEGDRGEFIRGWIGQSEDRTREIIAQVMGGVLFIDEAYSLVKEDSPRDFGAEVLALLLKQMEDNRDKIAFIFAGYKDHMETFLNANPGMQRRIGWRFALSEYGPHELCEIFEQFLWDGDYVLSNTAKARSALLIHAAWALGLTGKENGGFARTLAERTVLRHESRLAGKGGDYEFTTIEDGDIPIDRVARRIDLKAIDVRRLNWRFVCPYCQCFFTCNVSAVAKSQRCKCGNTVSLPWWSIDPRSGGAQYEALLTNARFAFRPALAREQKSRVKRPKPQSPQPTDSAKLPPPEVRTRPTGPLHEPSKPQLTESTLRSPPWQIQSLQSSMHGAGPQHDAPDSKQPEIRIPSLTQLPPWALASQPKKKRFSLTPDDWRKLLLGAITFVYLVLAVLAANIRPLALPHPEISRALLGLSVVNGAAMFLWFFARTSYDSVVEWMSRNGWL